MKKIYSLLLTAAALLVGTNAWAQNTVSLKYNEGAKAGKDTTFATLQAAIDYIAPGDSATITLHAKQTLEQGILIPHIVAADTAQGKRIANILGQRICIDLNGKNIEMKSGVSHTPISLMKGTLRLTGSGMVRRTADRNGNVFNRCAIVVTGTDGLRDGFSGTLPSGIIQADRSKQVWSTLYIDKDVTVYGHGNDCFAIGINEIGGSTVPNFADFNVSFLGYTTKYTVSGTDASKYPMWNKNSSNVQYSAFGARVYVDGTVDGEVRGINIVGNINQTPGVVEGVTSRKYNAYPYYDHYFPYVKIGATAEVYCKPEDITDNNNGGVYLGGWAVVDIEGSVHGQTGVTVKAGDVELKNGTVYSDSNTASNNGDYRGGASGSGIFITSSPSYAGESNVSITGDSHVTGNGGSAIVDVLGDGANNTKVTHVEITGGTIEGGDQGAINLTLGTKAETEVTGGTVDGTVSVTNTATQETTTVNVSTLVPNTDEYHTTTVSTGSGTVVVVSQGAAPTVANSVIGATENTSIKWQNTGTTEETLTANKSLKELEINENYIQTIIIPANKTLTAERVILGKKARIIVEAGGKFIVTGEQGIVAPVVENIELRSSESAQAIFLFHPNVSSNRHPNATVQLTSKGYCKNGDYSQQVWQRFGVPAYTAKEEEGAVIRYSTDQTKNPVTYNDASWIEVYDYSIDNWKTMPDADAFVPFQCYEASSVATEANHTVYTFKCPLMGNTDFTLPLNKYTEWNYYANSYMAPINIFEMLTSFKDNNANVRATVYVYRSSDNWWDNINLASGYFGAPQTTIDPMQAFIFQKREEGTADAVISYKNHIYNPDPTTTPVAAPAREREVFSAAIIEIAAADGAKDKLYLIESDKFSADFDNGYDAAKYMSNESFNLFAGEQLGMIATDNLEGTAISMTTKEQTSFTMTFNNVTNMEYAVRDMLTGTETAIVEGATYMFSTAANANVEGRFQIVPVAKMPTAIENIEETAAVKGIYTITGQYVGNDYHSLQNGVYVVDGKKIVK